METRRYVLGFYMTNNGTILIQKSKPDWQAGKWNGIGGSIEAGETPLQAMVREFGEEAGIETQPHAWTELLTLSGTTLGNTSKLWEMTVFTAFNPAMPLYRPRKIDEGLVCARDSRPHPMDETAKWLWEMCHDLHNHGIRIGAAQDTPAQEGSE